MTSNRRARIRPVWVPALLLAILLVVAALAACSGESSGSDAPRDEPRSQKTEFRNDDSVSAGHGDDTANDIQDDGQDNAAGLFVSVSAGGPHLRGEERRFCRLLGDLRPRNRQQHSLGLGHLFRD